MSQNHEAGGFKRKRNSDKGWKGKKRPKTDEEEEEQPQYTCRHPGSYPIDDLKALPFYVAIDESVAHIKRKYALCFSYLGTAYQGLQINPDCKSVEAELERALFLAGGIIETNFGSMQKIQWTRAARTDRGVHAISQCCAMKLLVDPDKRQEFIEKVNSILPNDIKLQGMTKVARSFNAKNLCGKRTYNYLLPTYVLKNSVDVNTVLTNLYETQGPIVGAGYEGGYVDPATFRSLNRPSLEEAYNQIKDFRVDTEKMSLLREALQCYIGTRCYHNFTSGKDATEMNANRFMMSFTASEPFVVESTGVEYILLSVQGQSFLLNQIRKMVAFAVAVVRGDATKEDLVAAFQPSQVAIPMAPSLGLYLFELFFDGYNMKQRRDGERDKHAKLRQLEKSGGNKTTPQPVATESKTEDADEQNNADSIEKDDDEDGQNREEVRWYDDAITSSRLHAFKDEILHPHIFDQEKLSLSFMFYLDYMRAFPHTYKVKPVLVKELVAAIEVAATEVTADEK